MTWQPGQVLSSSELTPDVIAAIKAALMPAQTLAITAWRSSRGKK